MKLSALTAISPIDGRYGKSTEKLRIHFSEFGLIKYRVFVEVEYFIALSELGLPQLPALSEMEIAQLRTITENFNEADALKIKEIEAVKNHDVKAVEFFLREKFEVVGLVASIEFIHFGLTSQDINNTAVPLQLKGALHQEYLPQLDSLSATLQEMAMSWKDVPLLARTHGQAASPTTLGKEIMVFVVRLDEQLQLFHAIPFAAKFGGATGNFNAHHVAYPTVDWEAFAKSFLENQLGLHRSNPTTQIEHYDHMAAQFDTLKRINTILIDMSRDIWQYVSLNYFGQKINKNETGSSAMPHKVNPIDFENAEGNLGLANAFYEFLSAKLPISRLQRDLTDSTVLRNIGVPISHSFIALKSLEKGLSKLILNEKAIREDLEQNWAVVAEALQTILRREGYPNPYDKLKDHTRKNDKITESVIREFIGDLDVSDEIKSELYAVTPFNYTGLLPKIME
jgi:adenylosuccinate lyase